MPAVLVLAVPADHDVDGAAMLHLDHLPLFLDVALIEPLANKAIASGRLVFDEPTPGLVGVGGERAQVPRRAQPRNQTLEPPPPLGERLLTEVLPVLCEEVESDQGGRGLLGEHRHP